MSDTSMDIGTTYGSLLWGALLSSGLSGIVGVQSIIYFKLYPNDGLHWKMLVPTVWFVDFLHSILVCVSLFHYFVVGFYGTAERIDFIPWTIAFSVVVTAIQTLITHCFFARKIYRSSGGNWLIVGPILILAICRLVAAAVTTYEMLYLKHFSAFTRKYPGWIFTLGLSLSSFVDILITAWLCYFLRKIRRGIGSTLMINVVDTLTLYTLENGGLPCAATTASLICWLIMPHNLVFLGLHFIIEKLYANSLLASLNTRKELRQMQILSSPWHSEEPSWPTVHSGTEFVHVSPPIQTLTSTFATSTDSYTRPHKARRQSSRQNLTLNSHHTPTQLSANVQRTMERTSEEESLRSLPNSYSPNNSIRRSGVIRQLWAERLP